MADPIAPPPLSKPQQNKALTPEPGLKIPGEVEVNQSASSAETQPIPPTTEIAVPAPSEVNTVSLAPEAAIAGIGVSPAAESAPVEAPKEPEIAPASPEVIPPAPEALPQLDAEAQQNLAQKQEVEAALAAQVAEAAKERQSVTPAAVTMTDEKLAEDALMHDSINIQQGSGPLRRMLESILKLTGKK